MTMKQTPFSTGRPRKLGAGRIVYLWLRSREGFPLKGEAFDLKKQRVQSAFYEMFMTKPQAAHEVDIELQLLTDKDIHALIHMYEQFLNADVIDYLEAKANAQGKVIPL